MYLMIATHKKGKSMSFGSMTFAETAFSDDAAVRTLPGGLTADPIYFNGSFLTFPLSINQILNFDCPINKINSHALKINKLANFDCPINKMNNQALKLNKIMNFDVER